MYSLVRSSLLSILKEMERDLLSLLPNELSAGCREICIFCYLLKLLNGKHAPDDKEVSQRGLAIRDAREAC